MVKQDLVDAVVDRTGLSRVQAKDAVESVFDLLRTAIARGERIELRRFGVFDIRPRKTGIGRNPRTGEIVPIKPGKAVRFRPGKAMRDLALPR